MNGRGNKYKYKYNYKKLIQPNKLIEQMKITDL